MRFVLVNERSPRRQSFCVSCDEPIGAATCGKSGHTSPTAITIATKITARVRSWFSKAGQERHEPALPLGPPRLR